MKLSNDDYIHFTLEKEKGKTVKNACRNTAFYNLRS